jgi:leucyl aminopeptidase
MEFITRLATAEAIKTDCVAVGVYDGGELTPSARRIDAASKGALRAAIKSGDVTGKAGSTVMLRALPGVAAARVVLVGLGKKDEFKTKTYVDTVRAAVKNAGAGAGEVALTVEDWHVADRDARWQARLAVASARETAFRTDELKSKKDNGNGVAKKVVLLLSRREPGAERGIAEGVAMANGMDLTKRLGNLPGNICTPSFLADQARKLGRENKVGIEVFDRRGIERLKMGSFLSVAKGSAQEPRLIVFKYTGGARNGAPIALVGKGITFDSGGISLKPGANMDEMKFDMCGAATVFGTMRAAAELKLKLNLVGVVVACENMPSSTASKPGDIVTSMSGQTVEVLNTDAEGRLILNDALTFVSRFKPSTVIDIATLTGACVVALGAVNSGLFTEDDELARALVGAGRTMNDYAWRMPLDDEYQEQLKSNFADMANIGTPGAGAIVAACFLQRFAKGYKWAHLDIAGTAWKGGASKGASGRPVPLLTQYLIEQAG